MPPTATAETTTTTTALPDKPTFQEAFAAARAEHSKETTTEVADDEHALDADEASTATTADGDDAPEKTGTTATSETTTTATSDPTGLLTDAEFTALQTKHADNPVALRKALEGAFTKKTQALSDERKSVERLRSYADIIDAYEEDPAATVRALAQQHGLQLVDATGTTAPATTAAATDTAVASVVEDFKKGLGPDLEYLADGLAPAITQLVERLTKTTVDAATAPLKQGQEVLLGKAATEATERVMKSFGEKHPDWKEHEEAMLGLSQKLRPNGMDEQEYLDHLYDLATRDTQKVASDKKIADQVAEGVKAALKKMERGAANTDTRLRSTPESQVTAGPPDGRAPTFQEAHEAAKRGERWN